MLIPHLERIGFLSYFTRRLGPCFRCERVILTYYLPETKQWLCEDCFYSNEDNKIFISIINSLGIENTMATPNIQELMARLNKLESENRALKAKSTDNVFESANGNITIKNRQASQRGWALPTKWSNGQTYLRCGDFPMGYFISQDKTKLILHTEIPVTSHEVEFFTSKFLSQNVVTAKKPKKDGETPSTPATPPVPSSTPTVSSIPTVTTPTGKSWSTLPQSERDTIMASAKGLVDAGLFPNLKDALEQELSSRNITK